MAFGSKKKTNVAPRPEARPAPAAGGPTPGGKPASGHHPSGQSQARPAPNNSNNPNATKPKPPVDRNTIGRSLRLTGELTGHEDITVDGNVEGKVSLPDNRLTIGEPGHIQGEVHAKAVIVVGSVVGNITADDRVEVAATGSVQGDISAPRVILAEGCRFKGKIDMPEGGQLGSSTMATFNDKDEKNVKETKELAKALDSFELE